ncbi:PH domain-containing protein [Aneurinibacillus aneurinilyticus]|jgi:hypothetical protein|uniref:PH domain-containing protein n=3 Tax=Aneurinibacillus aneurinilyticus TaxID=1391 RepID=A0A848D6Q7_ANEAE|nr:PH domain-containing protein [Aneurinibacillus aneurinilyticus]NMF01501.1 PH domain-containing protein [Aneurinibacillus aneurinilyticus]
MRFPSRKDLWLTIIIWGTMLFSIIIGGYALLLGQLDIVDMIVIFFLSVALPVFLLWIWLTTYYVLDENNLIIKCGPFRKTIPLNTIKSVKKTMNPLSSPALSLKRLEIIHGQHSMTLISPKNRDEFIKILQRRCPQAKVFP